MDLPRPADPSRRSPRDGRGPRGRCCHRHLRLSPPHDRRGRPHGCHGQRPPRALDARGRNPHPAPRAARPLRPRERRHGRTRPARGSARGLPGRRRIVGVPGDGRRADGRQGPAQRRAQRDHVQRRGRHGHGGLRPGPGVGWLPRGTRLGAGHVRRHCRSGPRARLHARVAEVGVPRQGGGPGPRQFALRGRRGGAERRGRHRRGPRRARDRGEPGRRLPLHARVPSGRRRCRGGFRGRPRGRPSPPRSRRADASRVPRRSRPSSR